MPTSADLNAHPAIIAAIRSRITDPRRVTSISAFTPHTRPPYPPASAETLARAEERLGFRLPELLRKMYLEVGNGGYGPGYGIVGLEGGYLETDNIAFHDGSGLDLVQLYDGFRGVGEPLSPIEHDFDAGGSLRMDPEKDVWYNQLVPISNWGCWRISCIDCSKKNAPVLLLVGYEYELLLESHSFDEWVCAWLADNIQEEK